MAGCWLAADPPGLVLGSQPAEAEEAETGAVLGRRQMHGLGRQEIVGCCGPDLDRGDSRFRSTVDMSRHRFGAGEYRYFAEPFPDPVTGLKEALYPKLLPIARSWWGRSAGLVFHDAA